MKPVQVGIVRQIVSTPTPAKWGPVFQVLGFERGVSNSSRSVESALATVLATLSAALRCCAYIRSASPERRWGRYVATGVISWRSPWKLSPKRGEGS